MTAWLWRLVQRAFCAHVWTYDATVLRSSREVAVARRRCERCGATLVTHQNAKITR